MNAIAIATVDNETENEARHEFETSPTIEASGADIVAPELERDIRIVANRDHLLNALRPLGRMIRKTHFPILECVLLIPA